MSAQEQDILNMCLLDTSFEIRQIHSVENIAALKLLKLLYSRIKKFKISDKTLASELSYIKESDFINNKIEKLIQKHVQDPMQMFGAPSAEWLKSVCSNCPFMTTQGVRMMLFRLTFFDKQRSMHFWVQYLKSLSTGISNLIASIWKIAKNEAKS